MIEYSDSFLKEAKKLSKKLNNIMRVDKKPIAHPASH